MTALKEFRADCIVAEVNNGGEMIETLIRQVDANVPYRAVRASQRQIHARRTGRRALRTRPGAPLRRFRQARRPDVPDDAGFRPGARRLFARSRRRPGLGGLRALLFEQGRGAACSNSIGRMARNAVD